MTPQIVAPWSDQSALSRIAYSELFHGEIDILTRETAMTVPAVVRARDILISTIANTPLRAYKGPDALTTQPTWLYRTNGQVTPFHRMAMTIDDLIFYGDCLWVVERGADGQITDAARVNRNRWRIDNGRILVDEKPADSAEVIYIPGSGEGLLATGGNTLKGAIQTERAWIGRIQSPIPAMELRQTQADTVTSEESQALVDAWMRARTSPNSAVAFIPYGVELHTHGETSADLYIEGRNANRLDVANLMNIPASLLDGSTAAASLTYETQEGRRNDYYDTTVPYWVAPLEARLSMDDVTPRGTRIRFDFTNALSVPASPIGDPNIED